MVVNGVLGFDVNGSIVALDGFFVLFELVEGSSQVPVVGSHFRVYFDGLGCEFYFLFKVAQLPHCLSFEIEEVAGFILSSQV